MKRILLDTTVLVVNWRHPGVQASQPAETTNCINSITYIEFLQGANKRQIADAKAFLNTFEHIRLDAKISDKAIELIEIHSDRDGLRLADALIAATCLSLDLELVTYNRRHFKKIANLKLI
ncbi:MAG: PIN domain-containing protein [Chloracidobacterium sp.]|nr:PIN domain-containing protein [Chloracidobacterium sp.]